MFMWFIIINYADITQGHGCKSRHNNKPKINSTEHFASHKMASDATSGH